MRIILIECREDNAKIEEFESRNGLVNYLAKEAVKNQPCNKFMVGKEPITPEQLASSLFEGETKFLMTVVDDDYVRFTVIKSQKHLS